MTDRSNLKVGGFYWVIPSFDHDLDVPGDNTDDAHDERAAHWSNNAQPARFAGLTKDGREKWQFIGQDDPDPGMPYSDDHWWPVVWIGEEIV